MSQGYPRILRADDRVGAAGTTLTSSPAATTGYPALNVTDWKDYTLWSSSGANSYTLEADAGADVTADCIGLAGHNLFTVGARWKLDGKVNGGGGYVAVVAYDTPASNETIAKFFVQVSYRYWRITVDNNGGANFIPQLGIFYIGNKIEIPRLPATPHDPDAIEDHSNIVIGGQGHLLGVTNDYTVRKMSFNFPHITQAFMTATWLPFIASYRLSPFIFVWDYVNHPLEARLVAFSRGGQDQPFSGGVWREISLDLTGRLI